MILLKLWIPFPVVYAYCGFVVSRRRNQHSTLLERSLKACVAMPHLLRKYALLSLVFLIVLCCLLCQNFEFPQSEVEILCGCTTGQVFAGVNQFFLLFSRIYYLVPINIVHIVRMLVIFFDSLQKSVLTCLFVVKIFLTPSFCLITSVFTLNIRWKELVVFVSVVRSSSLWNSKERFCPRILHGSRSEIAETNILVLI